MVQTNLLAPHPLPTTQPVATVTRTTPLDACDCCQCYSPLLVRLELGYTVDGPLRTYLCAECADQLRVVLEAVIGQS